MKTDLSGEWEHYKRHTRYRILGIAWHTETLEKLVVYQALYGKKEIWARPYKMFFGKVEVDGEKVPRFSRIRMKINHDMRKAA